MDVVCASVAEVDFVSLRSGGRRAGGGQITLDVTQQGVELILARGMLRLVLSGRRGRSLVCARSQSLLCSLKEFLGRCSGMLCVWWY